MPYLSPLFRRTLSFPLPENPPQSESLHHPRLSRGRRENTLQALKPDLHAKHRISPYSTSGVRRDDAGVQTQYPTAIRFLRRSLAALAMILALGNAMAQTTLTARWAANPETDIAGYKVYLGTTSGYYSSVQTVTSGTSFVFTGLAPATTYYCAVQAYNTSGVTSEMSDEVVKTTAAAIPTSPEIAVSGPGGVDLATGSAGISCGAAILGNSADVQTLTITNKGDASLSLLDITTEGTNATDFLVATLSSGNLAPGASAAIDIIFLPSSAGPRAATLRIASNDADENPFLVSLTGEGLQETVNTAPEIAVEKADGTSLASGSASVGFGSLNLASNGTSQTLTIRNSGSAFLSGIAVSIDGTNASDFTVSGPATTSIAAGASASFSVTFKPSAAGTRSATLRIASNDADEASFAIALFGDGVATPEIAVEQPENTPLADGSALVGFGPLNLGASGIAKTFVIRNSGTAALTGIASSVDGANAADFTVSGPAATSIAAGASATFTVTFKPGAAGSRAATLHIASNDADENPFDIALTGNGVAVPEIAVEAPEGTGLTDNNSTITFSQLNLGAAGETKTVIIRNTGTAALSGISASVDGTHATDYTVAGPATTSIAAGASASFTVTFKPLGAGSRSAGLHITSNDADENPFDVKLAGSGVAVPEIVVEQPEANGLSDGNATIAFTSLTLGASSDPKTFVIRNSGTAVLTGIAITLDGNNAADFIVAGPGTASIAAGASATFTVTFKPSAAGARVAALRIASNDADENPFDIALSGNGVAAPEIVVEQPENTPLVDGNATIAFNSLTLGASSEPKTFVLRNSGTAPLTGIAATLDGANAADFTITGPASSSIAAGASATFTVSFKPGAAGARAAILRVASNDSDENPFDIALTGNGVAVPEIVVEAPEGSGLTDGSAAVAFGAPVVGTAGTTRSFVVRNAGSAALTGLAVSINGENAAEFTTTGLPSSSIAAGSSAVFSVTFTPASAGARSAALHITSNDADENPFDIALSGNGGTAPEIAINRLEGAELKSGDSTLAFGPANLLAPVSKITLVIRNTGTADLTGLAPSIIGDHAADFSVSALEKTTLAPGSGTSLTVSFKPTAPGLRVSTLRIASNDADENPFVIKLGGNGVSTPDIDITLTDGGVPVAGAAAINLGRVDLREQGTPRSLTIRNLGTADLVLTSITSSGKHPADFLITGPEATTLPPGASTTFSVVFKPREAGERVAKLLIQSNDPDENPFGIPVFGTGVATPEISVALAGGDALTSGATVDFGTVNANSDAVTRILRVTNTGTGKLIGLKTRRLDPPSGAFTVGDPGQVNLAPGESTNIKVSFRSEKSGTRTDTLQISGAEAADPRFTVVLTGTALAVPVIVVKASGTGVLADGQAYVSYGAAKRGVKTFTITNKGEARLRNLSLEANGADIADFTVSPLRATTLDPGESTTFKVVFDASSSSTVWAALHITSNDPETGTFDIVLTRKGKSAASSKKSAKAGKSASKANSPAEKPVISYVLIDGQKYRCITIPKTDGRNIHPRAVQVSGNLTDWSSGRNHTTVLKDNASVLKVRDNIPVSPGVKRYIRLK